MGFTSSAAETPEEAGRSSDVGSAITSTREPFLSAETVKNLQHLNLCGANSPDRAEARPDAIPSFQTVAVDDLRKAKEEAGDLIQAARAGNFDWGRAVELKDVVTGAVNPIGRTFFKWGGERPSKMSQWPTWSVARP